MQHFSIEFFGRVADCIFVNFFDVFGDVIDFCQYFCHCFFELWGKVKVEEGVQSFNVGLFLEIEEFSISVVG